MGQQGSQQLVRTSCSPANNTAAAAAAALHEQGSSASSGSAGSAEGQGGGLAVSRVSEAVGLQRERALKQEELIAGLIDEEGGPSEGEEVEERGQSSSEGAAESEEVEGEGASESEQQGSSRGPHGSSQSRGPGKGLTNSRQAGETAASSSGSDSSRAGAAGMQGSGSSGTKKASGNDSKASTQKVPHSGAQNHWWVWLVLHQHMLRGVPSNSACPLPGGLGWLLHPAPHKLHKATLLASRVTQSNLWSSPHPSHLSTSNTRRNLLNFELLMLGTLSVALPVVYWRKIRIRHL